MMHFKTRQHGFSLLELIIVLAVFAIILSAVSALFISIIHRQRAVLANQEIMSQASFVVEKMSRSLRDVKKDMTGTCTGAMGSTYTLTHYDQATDFYQGVKFLNDQNICQEFYLDDKGALKEVYDQDAPQNIFSDKFKITYLHFLINGRKEDVRTRENDTIQPRITLVMSIQKPSDQVVENNLPLVRFNTALAQSFPGIPTCGDGICEPGEPIYCSNRCPLADDCNACIAPPQDPTGFSCVNNLCISDPVGTAICDLNTTCGTIPPTITGLSCTNAICVQNPMGTDRCNLGAVCLPVPTHTNPPVDLNAQMVLQATVSQNVMTLP